jgi:hypothetical protein
MRAVARVLHHVHRARKVELVAVALATAGAGGAVGHLELRWLDAVGPWADIAAGLFALAGVLLPAIERRARRGEEEEES